MRLHQLTFLLVTMLFCSFSSTVNPQSWNPVAGGTNGYVSAMCSDTISNSLFVGGSFDTSGTVMTSNVSRWDGNYWNTVGSGLTGIVLELNFYNGELYAGCDNGSAPGNVFKWDGTNWTIVAGGTNAWVSAMAVYNGELYIGGAFDTAGAIAANYIAKWNGSAWSTVGAGTNDAVNALIVFNGELYAGGKFTLAGGNAANGIAKWDGNSWTSIGSGNGREVYSFGEYNGELYEGGTASSGSAEINKWNGSNWVAFDGGVQGGLGSMVSTMLVYNGELYVGGTILFAGTTSIPTNGIAKWDGTNWSAVGNGMDNGVESLDTLNGLLYAGGYFISADGNPAEHVAVWPTPVGVIEINNFSPSVQVFPNPSSTTLSFVFNDLENLRRIVILDQFGREIWRKESSETSILFPAEKFPNGLYYFRIDSENEVGKSGKFMVQH